MNVVTNQDTQNGYNRFDTCYGEVISTNNAGSYLKLDNGEMAFSYTGIKTGCKVLCTILTNAKENLYMRVGIDSVIEYVA